MLKVGILLGIILSGCTSVAHLADTMNKRNISSCITFSGTYGMFLGVHGVTATGNATILDCIDLR